MAIQGTPYQYVYTSRKEMEELHSEQGLNMAMDDQSDDDDVLDTLIQRATGRVNQHLNKVFDSVDLQNSQRVREIATIIACYLLSVRRGNPSLYMELYLEAMEDLRDIASGELYLAELPRSSGSPINMQNISSDNRYPFTPMRVDPISATKITGKERVARPAIFWWF